MMPHGPIEVLLHHRTRQHGQGSQLTDLHQCMRSVEHALTACKTVIISWESHELNNELMKEALRY